MNEAMRRDVVTYLRIQQWCLERLGALGYVRAMSSRDLAEHRSWGDLVIEALTAGPLAPSESPVGPVMSAAVGKALRETAEELGKLAEPEEVERVEGERPGVWLPVPGCDARVFAPTTEGASGAELLAVFRLSGPFDDPSLEQTLRVVYDMGRRRGRGEDKAATELRAEYEAAVRERTIRECAAALDGNEADAHDLSPDGAWLLKKMGLES